MRLFSPTQTSKHSGVAANRCSRTSPCRDTFCAKLESFENRRLMSAAIVQTNLVSDSPDIPAQVTDPHLVNPWGLAASPDGAWCIANEDSETSTQYDTSNAQVSIVPPTVQVPGGPAGIIFNGGTGFNSDSFVFANTDGSISGWKPADGNNAAIEATHPGALYLGLAIATNSHGDRQLYAADFANNRIDVYDQSFQSVTNLPGHFTDSKLPDDYSAFNIQAINNRLYVEYAPLSSVLAGTAKKGEGAVDVYNADGQLQQRLIRHGHLNQPWAIAMAPDNFGPFSNDLLVGNFGDGHINAFDPTNGHFDGELKDAKGQPIAIRHLWGLAFGNGGAAGPTNTLYFTAGLTSHLDTNHNDPFHGLFGSLQVAPKGHPHGCDTRLAVSDGNFWDDTAESHRNAASVLGTDADNLDVLG